MYQKAQQKPAMVWGSFTLGSCVCHRHNKGTCASWWACSVRQINSVSRLYSIRSFTDSSQRKWYSMIFHHIPILPKKMPIIFSSFISCIEIITKHLAPQVSRYSRHQGVDCVKQLCEKYLSLAVEEEALANSLARSDGPDRSFFQKEWGQNSQGSVVLRIYWTYGLSGKLAILSLECLRFKEISGFLMWSLVIEICWTKTAMENAEENVEAFLNEAERFQALQLVQYCHLSFGRNGGYRKA